jgi:flavodoxin
MKRILFVYYSRTGTMRRVAAEVANALDADVEEIVDHTRRRGFFGYGRCAREAWRQETTTIAHPQRDPADYDLVVVGTPIWCWSLSSPVRTYLRQCRSAFKAVAFVCTCGGSGHERVFRQMTHEAAADPTAVLVLRQGDVERDRTRAAITTFAAQVLEALPAIASAAAKAEAHAHAPAA